MENTREESKNLSTLQTISFKEGDKIVSEALKEETCDYQNSYSTTAAFARTLHSERYWHIAASRIALT